MNFHQNFILNKVHTITFCFTLHKQPEKYGVYCCVLDWLVHLPYLVILTNIFHNNIILTKTTTNLLLHLLYLFS